MGYLYSCTADSAISTCALCNFNFAGNTTFEIKEFSYSDLHSSTDGFSKTNFLGKGSHGSVYKATLNLNNRKLIAAVKKTNRGTNSSADNEIEILSRVRGPRLVNLLGFAPIASEDRRFIVVEYMPNGSLYDALHSSATPPSWYRRIRLALQIAKAVRFLHLSDPPVIHRDIKSSNVLIDRKRNARLGDFGLALRGRVEDVRVKCTPPAGTFGYLDPGYLAPGDLSTKSDVFSFGILLLEIISGRNAIDMSYSPPSVVDWAAPLIKAGEYSIVCDPRIGMPANEEAIRQLAVLAARCVKSKVEKRPAMMEVVESLITVSKLLSSPIWNRLRRRRVGTSGLTVKFKPLDESTELIKGSRCGGSRRNPKVSSVPVTELENLAIGSSASDRVARSKSTGSTSEIKYIPLDSNVGRRKPGLAVKTPMVGLRKSRSTGVLQSRRSIISKKSNDIVIGIENSPNNRREFETSKLMVNNFR